MPIDSAFSEWLCRCNSQLYSCYHRLQQSIHCGSSDSRNRLGILVLRDFRVCCNIFNCRNQSKQSIISPIHWFNRENSLCSNIPSHRQPSTCCSCKLELPQISLTLTFTLNSFLSLNNTNLFFLLTKILQIFVYFLLLLRLQQFKSTKSTYHTATTFQICLWWWRQAHPHWIAMWSTLTVDEVVSTLLRLVHFQWHAIINEML